MSEYLGTTFGKLRIPLLVFHEGEFYLEDVRVVYKENKETMRWDEERREWLYDPDVDTKIPKDVRDYIKPLVEKRKREAEARGAPFYDGQMVKLVDYGIEIDDNQGAKKWKLVLKLAPTSWFTYSATNHSLDEKVLKDNEGNPISIREKYKINSLSLDDCLANSIGVSTTLITKDGNIIIVERSEKLGQYPGLYGVVASGFMNRLRDVIDEIPHPFATIQRELEEEMGIKCSVNDFRLFGVGRALDDLHGELFGEVRTSFDTQYIMSAPKKAKYENLRIISVPFKPKEVLKYLVQTISEVPKGITSGLDTWIIGQTPKWDPAHAYATIQSLIKEYGYDKVMKELRELGYA